MTLYGVTNLDTVEIGSAEFKFKQVNPWEFPYIPNDIVAEQLGKEFRVYGWIVVN